MLLLAPIWCPTTNAWLRIRVDDSGCLIAEMTAADGAGVLKWVETSGGPWYVCHKTHAYYAIVNDTLYRIRGSKGLVEEYLQLSPLKGSWQLNRTSHIAFVRYVFPEKMDLGLVPVLPPIEDEMRPDPHRFKPLETLGNTKSFSDEFNTILVEITEANRPMVLFFIRGLLANPEHPLRKNLIKPDLFQGNPILTPLRQFSLKMDLLKKIESYFNKTCHLKRKLYLDFNETRMHPLKGFDKGKTPAPIARSEDVPIDLLDKLVDWIGISESRAQLELHIGPAATYKTDELKRYLFSIYIITNAEGDENRCTTSKVLIKEKLKEGLSLCTGGYFDRVERLYRNILHQSPGIENILKVIRTYLVEKAVRMDANLAEPDVHRDASIFTQAEELGLGVDASDDPWVNNNAYQVLNAPGLLAKSFQEYNHSFLYLFQEVILQLRSELAEDYGYQGSKGPGDLNPYTFLQLDNFFNHLCYTLKITDFSEQEAFKDVFYVGTGELDELTIDLNWRLINKYLFELLSKEYAQLPQKEEILLRKLLSSDDETLPLVPDWKDTLIDGRISIFQQAMRHGNMSYFNLVRAEGGRDRTDLMLPHCIPHLSLLPYCVPHHVWPINKAHEFLKEALPYPESFQFLLQHYSKVYSSVMMEDEIKRFYKYAPYYPDALTHLWEIQPIDQKYIGFLNQVRGHRMDEHLFEKSVLALLRSTSHEPTRKRMAEEMMNFSHLHLLQIPKYLQAFMYGLGKSTWLEIMLDIRFMKSALLAQNFQIFLKMWNFIESDLRHHDFLIHKILQSGTDVWTKEIIDFLFEHCFENEDDKKFAICRPELLNVLSTAFIENETSDVPYIFEVFLKYLTPDELLQTLKNDMRYVVRNYASLSLMRGHIGTKFDTFVQDNWYYSVGDMRRTLLFDALEANDLKSTDLLLFGCKRHEMIAQSVEFIPSTIIDKLEWSLLEKILQPFTEDFRIKFLSRPTTKDPRNTLFIIACLEPASTQAVINLVPSCLEDIKCLSHLVANKVDKLTQILRHFEVPQLLKVLKLTHRTGAPLIQDIIFQTIDSTDLRFFKNSYDDLVIPLLRKLPDEALQEIMLLRNASGESMVDVVRNAYARSHGGLKVLEYLMFIRKVTEMSPPPINSL